MNPFRLRAWDARNKRMIYFEEVKVLKDNKGLFFGVKNIGNIKDPFQFSKLLLYTGINDRRDRKIYEGDVVRRITPIVKDEKKIWKIIWENGAFKLNAGPLSIPLTRFETRKVSIIGNFYQKPELGRMADSQR